MTRLVRVAGESMTPTYRPSDLLLTRPVGRGGVPVQRGDVAVFRHGDITAIKRVAGVPGDVVELEAGRLFVNGESLDGRPRARGASTEVWCVPAAAFFMAGDNPSVSDDSRVWDTPFVPVADIGAVVTRRLAWTHRRRPLTPHLPTLGAALAA
ncbi:MAG: signal peptidase I [Demequina sp.]